MGLSSEDREALFGDAEQSEEESATERRARVKRMLRELGVDIPYTDSELLDLIDEVLKEELPGGSAEEMFRSALETGIENPGAFRRSSERASEEVDFNEKKGTALDLLVAELLRSGSGRTFRPSVMQQPSERELFSSTEEAALGPAPELAFRSVYPQVFPELGKGEGPFERFAQKQFKELENQFLTEVYQQFTQPGFIDTLRGDYELLYRQKERGDFEGSGGSIPAFEDFIKQRINQDFTSFLTTRTSEQQLRKAFELASPDERGQREAGSLAPPRRIL